MKKLCVLMFIMVGMCSLSFAQDQVLSQANKAELITSISESPEFQKYISENERYLELREADQISEEERKVFHQQQKKRVDNVKANFPQLAELPEKEKQAIIRKATTTVLKSME